jgi:hypothetical protein
MLRSNVRSRILGLVKENQLEPLPFTDALSTGDCLKQKELVYLIVLFR